LPEGADAVVQVELTEPVGDSAVFLQNVDIAPGRNMLPLGISLRAGDPVLKKGAMLRAIEIGVLAEIGRDMVTVIPRPRLAVLPTGNELVSIGERPASGQIRNSNGPMLVVSANRAEADAIELSIARDNRDELARLIEQGLTSDILVLSGGVSAGKFDLVPQVLAELGVQQVFHKIALRPGKPLWFGVKQEDGRRVLVFALPGNPVSSLVCFELFVRPAIGALAGRGFAELPTVQAKLTHTYEHAGGRAACLPALVTESAEGASSTAKRIGPLGLVTGQQSELRVQILTWHGSADIFTLTRANALAHFGVENKLFASGDSVHVNLI
jgi:molybdopterin molybdotransferase